MPVYGLSPLGMNIMQIVHHFSGTFSNLIALLKRGTRYLAMSALRKWRTVKPDGPGA
jgi:hypothetical protein